jgi:serine/threonine protein kinase
MDKHAAERLQKGTVINNRYEVLRFVAEGGQKRVYEVKDLELQINKAIVLKEMKRSACSDMDIASMQLFEQECIILMKLSHPSLPKIYDFFIAQGTFYLIQEFIEGDELDRFLAKGFLPEQQALEFSLQLAEFLDYLHSASPAIIYRDMKPANVIVGKDNLLHVVDMSGALLPGIGKHAEMVKVKTTGYFPPDKKGDSGPDTDIYALGVCLYEMLTRHNVSRTPLPPIDELRDNISPETKNILGKCVFFGSSFRIKTAWELKIELEEAIKSYKKASRVREKEKKSFFESIYLAMHNGFTRTVKPLGPLIMLLLILGIPLIPFLYRFFSGKSTDQLLSGSIGNYLWPISLIIYIIWVRFLGTNEALGKIYRAFHSRTKLFGGYRLITILVVINFLVIAAVYVETIYTFVAQFIFR